MSDAMTRVRVLAARQDAVVSLGQVLALGLDKSLPGRLVARDFWQRPHRGVFVVHSGPLPPTTRARAALVHAGCGAVLSHATAAELHGFGRRTGAGPGIDVTVPAARTVTASGGVRVHRSRRLLPDPGTPFRTPLPRTPAAATVLDLMVRMRSEDDVVGLVTDAVRAGLDPGDLRREALARPTGRRRAIILDLVGVVTAGVESPMELRYHRDVERRHRLPAARLQQRAVLGGRWTRADDWYQDFGVRVELDGELAHPGGRTARDAWRDNAAGIEHRELTLRYRWAHVAGDPCLTASQVAAALRSRGWTGTPRPCSPICAVGDPDRWAVARGHSLTG